MLCDSLAGMDEAFRAGALGCITTTDEERLKDVSSVVPFPTSIVNSEDYVAVLSYLNSTKYVLMIIPFCLIIIFFSRAK